MGRNKGQENTNKHKLNTMENKLNNLKTMIYNLLISNPEIDMGQMSDCMEAAECLVNEWIELNNIKTIK